MLPFYIDIAPNQDATTTLYKEKYEYKIQALPTAYDEDLIKLNDFMNDELISVCTNLSMSNGMPLVYIDDALASSLSDDFEVISEFKFKNSKKIKARLKKTVFTPNIIID